MKKHFSFRFNPNRLFILMLLGMTCLCQNVKADEPILIKFKGGTVYFDNSKTNWNQVAFFLGRDWDNYNHTKVSEMTHIDHTALWYVSPSAWYDDNKDKAKENPNYIRITTCTNYETGNFGSSDYCSSGHFTAIYRANYTFDVNHWYLFTTASGSDNTSISVENRENDQNYGRAWNRDQCIHARISTDGGSTFSTPAKAPAFLRVEGHAFDAYNTCNSYGGNQIAAGTPYEMQKTGIGYTATVKMIVNNVVSGVTFLGFYDGDGKLLKSATDAAKNQAAGQYVYEYMMHSFDNGNVYARFKETMYDVSLTGFATAKEAAGPITNGSATISTPAGMQYDNHTTTGGVTNVQRDNNVMTFNATANGTLTANYIYLEPQVSHSGDANYTVGGAAIKLNPTYTNVANDATYTWTTTDTEGKLTFSANNVANPNITITAAGTYSVTVTVSQDTKNPKSDSQTITIEASGTGDPTCGSCFDY